MKVFRHMYQEVISLENLFQAWDEFKKGKRKKIDVGFFEKHLEDNIFELHGELAHKTYRHSAYIDFFIRDPKVRHIHKASVQDRVLHHALFRGINPIFEASFISSSYSCRKGYGTHKGFNQLVSYARKVSKNYSGLCWALKCDVRKFFDSVDHEILLGLIERKVKDPELLWLIRTIVESYHTEIGKGLPLGNLTSQLFANLYLNSLDQFIKHKLKVRHYVRYADDFILLNRDKEALVQILPEIERFLRDTLKLQLHPRKVSLRKLQWGIDFLGYVALPYHEVMRTKTKRRIYRKLMEGVKEYKADMIDSEALNQSIQSYLGILKHANTHEFEETLRNQIYFWLFSSPE